MIRTGYACINTSLPTAGRTFRLSGYSDERMLEVTRYNLKALKEILEWNLDHSVYLFRITSQLVPFGSHPVNQGLWKTALKQEFREIGDFALRHSMRLSMHPGQYTVLSTPDEQILNRSIDDLRYHDTILSLMGLDNSHVICLHGGGAYGNKTEALKRLINNLKCLPGNIKKRLVLENDERVFNAQDILCTCRRMKLPAVLDVFHHSLLPSHKDLSLLTLIESFKDTWSHRRQKIHYSNQAAGKNKGAHCDSVDLSAFGLFYKEIRGMDLDVMIETKDKQSSVLRLREVFKDLR